MGKPAMTCFIDLGLCLLAAHLLGDFVFQTDRTVAQKKRLPVLGFHALTHAILAYALVGWWTVWWLPAFVFFLHGLIDFIKVRIPSRKAGLFLADQAAHMAVLAGLVAWIGGTGASSLWAKLWGRPYDRALIVAIGGILCVRAAAILIGFWVQPCLDEINRRGLESVGSKIRGLPTGGRIIGQWERALIFLFVGAGQPGAIGFLIAAKSVFRFGELKDHENRMEAEYITIGTLMSFGFAVAVSFVTFWLIRHW